jgi:AraC-like DNA-binding protein
VQAACTRTIEPSPGGCGVVSSEELFRNAYRPGTGAPQLFKALLSALVAYAGLSGASLHLNGLDIGETDRATGRNDGTDARETSTVLPIVYANAAIGELWATWPHDPTLQRARSTLCTDFARRCAFLAKRHDLQCWGEQRLGRPLRLVGTSRPLRDLEVFVERAAHSLLPVLLSGEFGTEKALLAAAIHCCGPRRDGPFFEVNCVQPAGLPAQWMAAARGGTLFFNGIDQLAPQLQQELPQHMHSRLDQWLSGSHLPDLRVIATTTADLSQRVSDGSFSPALLAELDFLPVRVPPLRERADDIAALVVSVLDRHGHHPQEKLTDELLAACQAYAWPGNLGELERVIARLAVMSDDRPIREADMLCHTPWIMAAAAPRPVSEPVTPVAPVARPQPAALPSEHWVRCAISRNLAELNRLHDSLRKALLYLGEHYAEAITLGQLAQASHVSPSHLCHLFRSGLSTAFKPLLQQIRVEKAKELLAADGPQRITEVALSVGFADLSHFERSFRRFVGRSPREYRRAPA